jgi:hypothetical protein
VTSVPTTLSRPTLRPRRRRVGTASTSLVAISAVGLLVVTAGTAQAAAVPVGLGTAGSFAVLAGAGITNTGPTTITGDIGTFPTTTEDYTAGPITQPSGVDHAGDAVTQGAKTDLITAYNAAAGELPPHAVAGDLAGQTLTAGVYNSASSLGLSGALTLNAAGDPDAVFVFQAGSSLTTGPGSSVVLLNGAQACNVYWQVGSSATLDTTTQFRGNILALTDIHLLTGATVEGRVLARNGEVTLQANTITRPSCTTPVDHSAADAADASAASASAAAASAAAASAAASASSPAATTRRPTYGQVRRVPVGAVDTGDGSMAEELHRSSAR